MVNDRSEHKDMRHTSDSAIASIACSDKQKPFLEALNSLEPGPRVLWALRRAHRLDHLRFYRPFLLFLFSTGFTRDLRVLVLFKFRAWLFSLMISNIMASSLQMSAFWIQLSNLLLIHGDHCHTEEPGRTKTSLGRRASFEPQIFNRKSLQLLLLEFW